MKLIDRPPPRRANTNTMPERRRPWPTPRRIVAGGRPPNLRTHVRIDDLSREGITMVIFFYPPRIPSVRIQHTHAVLRFSEISSVNPYVVAWIGRYFQIVNAL